MGSVCRTCSPYEIGVKRGYEPYPSMDPHLIWGQGSWGERSGRRPPRTHAPYRAQIVAHPTNHPHLIWGQGSWGRPLYFSMSRRTSIRPKPNIPMGPCFPLASFRRPSENRFSNTFDEFCLPNFIFIFARQVDFKNFEILFISSKVFESPDKYGSPMPIFLASVPRPSQFVSPYDWGVERRWASTS